MTLLCLYPTAGYDSDHDPVDDPDPDHDSDHDHDPDHDHHQPDYSAMDVLYQHFPKPCYKEDLDTLTSELYLMDRTTVSNPIKIAEFPPLQVEFCEYYTLTQICVYNISVTNMVIALFDAMINSLSGPI